MADEVGREDLRAAVGSCVETLQPVIGLDWETRAGDLDWTCRRTLDHMTNAMVFYSAQLAMRATQRLPPIRNGDDSKSPAELLTCVQTAGAILGELIAAAPPDARGFHPAGMADRSGFAAMACDEVLIHTADIAAGLGLDAQPPEELCRRVIARLFPWAPPGLDPWQTLRWLNGRASLPEQPRLDPNWFWQCAPLSEWDGTIKRRTAPPGWR